jgi:signal-transduction protein with cAMP-binding, CBS, and nucleotidyltransferase domain
MKTCFSVRDGMTNKPVMAKPKTTIQDCAKLMAKHDVGSLIIGEPGKIKGLVTEEDFVRKAILKSIKSGSAVSNIMETDLVTITPEKDIYDALLVMRDNNLRHLPVVEKDKLVGLITLKDILKIEPQLFDLIVEDIELREEHRKPITERLMGEEVCEECGKLTTKIKEQRGSLLCTSCIKKG